MWSGGSRKQRSLEGLRGDFSEIPFQGSHLFSCCQIAVAPERYFADLFWRRSPAQICLPSALLKECSCNLTSLIISSLNKTRSTFIFWLYLLLMPSPKFRAKVQKCWILRVTDTKLLFCPSPLQCWCGPDLLQGDLSTAPSRCKALRHRSYGAHSSRRGSVHHLPSQSNYNPLVHSSPQLYWARLKNSSTWRFVANCLLGGYVFHHLSRLTSRFIFSALL